MPAENNVVIRLNVKSDTGAIARTQAMLRTLGSDVDRSGKLFGKASKNFDMTKRALTAFEKSAMFASKAIGMTFKTALMNAGAQMAIFGAGIATVNGLFAIGNAAVKLYKFAMSGLAGVFAMAAAGAGVFAAALREQAAAMSSFQYSSQKQFGPAINQARVALANLERDTQLAVLGTKALTGAFQAASKHSEFTGASQSALKQMANFALATGNPEKAMAAAGDFIGLLEKRKASIGQIQKAMKATMGDDMYKKIQEANKKAKKEDKVNLGTVKGIREAVMSGKLAKMAGVEDMLETMNGTLIGQLKSYLGQAKSLFADFGQPLLAPVKDAFKEIFSTLKYAFMKISVSFQQFAGKQGLPAIVTFVEKLSNLMVNLTQKYLPGAAGWFEKFARPFQYMKEFFKETLPNTLRPYKESARVITDMFGKIFGPLIGGNVKRVGDLIKDNKVELLDFADATGRLLQNLNKLSGEMMKAFMRVLPLLTPIINSLASLVGMLSKVFGMFANLGGLGGGGEGGGGANILGSIGSALMMGMMFKGKGFLGNKASYTQGASNGSMLGRFWNSRMGLAGTPGGDALYTNRNARRMAMQTGQVAYLPGNTGSQFFPGGGRGAGGGGVGGSASPSGAQEPTQLSLYNLTSGGAKSRFRGRVSIINPKHLKRSEVQGMSLQKTMDEEIQFRTGRTSDEISRSRAMLGLRKGESLKGVMQEHTDLSALAASGAPLSVRQQRRLDQLNALTSPIGGGPSQLQRQMSLEEGQTLAQNAVMRREARVAQQIANPTGLTPYQKQKRQDIVASTTSRFERKGAQYRATQDSYRARGDAASAAAASARAAGDMDAAAKFDAQARKAYHKSAVFGTRADNLQDPYRTTAAGNLERRTDEVTGRQYYDPALATRRERRLNAEQGYETATAGGRTIEGKLDELNRKQQQALQKSADLRFRSEIQSGQGQGLRAKLNLIRSNIYEKQAGGGNIFPGFGTQKNVLLGTKDKTGAQRMGVLAGNAYKKFASGRITGNLLPGGPGLLGAKDANGAYTSRTGRVLGGQSQGANMATSIGMSFLASKGVGDQGSMALGASLAPMFGPMAALAVGFGGSALKAKTAKGGAMAGAIAGAAIGTMVPVIGTAVGAAIGAVVGFAAGTINRGRLERKAAKGVAEAIAKGYEQKASYDAFTRFTESPTGGGKQMSRADYFVRTFDQMGKLAKAFGDAGGEGKTRAQTDATRNALIDSMVATGQLTEQQGKDAKKHNTAFTKELEEQAKNYKTVGKILTDSYNPKINRMAELTGKSAKELEKMADTMGVNLLDPTLKSIDALKQLGFFISKTADQLKTELSNAMIDAIAGLRESQKVKDAPLVMNEIATGFGQKARAGGLDQAGMLDFIDSLVQQANVVNPNDPGAALSLVLQSMGVGPDGKINPNATVFTGKGPLRGTYEAIKNAGGDKLMQELLFNPETGVGTKMQFELYSQMQGMATDAGMALPSGLQQKIIDQTKNNPVLLAKLYSGLLNDKSKGVFTVPQAMLDAANDATLVPSERKKNQDLVNQRIVNNIKRVVGDDVFNQLGLTPAGLTESTTAGETKTAAAIDLMTDGEKAILEGLTKQWSEIAKSMSTGSAPNWFNETPVWWSKEPSWYQADTNVPKAKDTPTSRVQQTLARHSQIDSGITGKRTVTSALRNWGLGSLKSDHVTGNAYDLVGQNLGAYAVAVKRSGGFAEFHGGQADRHLHVVPGTGDSSMPSVVGIRSSGGSGAVSNTYNITVNGATQDPEQIANAVMEKIKRSQRSMSERA